MYTKRVARRFTAGLTLVELVIFIVVIGIGVAGVLAVMRVTSSQGADPLLRKQALLIAEGLLEEVQLARYTYCHAADPVAETAADAASCTTPEDVGLAPLSTEARPFYNVNDYVDTLGVQKSFTSGDTTGTITDVSGNLVAYSGNYKAKVMITSEDALGPAGAAIPAGVGGTTPADTDVLRIQVEVTYGPNNEKLVLDGYRTRYAPNSIP
jgi:MSHA pilin protein MshD